MTQNVLHPVEIADPRDPNSAFAVLRPLLALSAQWAPAWVASGNEWKPQANFGIAGRDSLLAAFVTLSHFGNNARAYHAGCYLPGILTLEVEFDDVAGSRPVIFYNRLPERMNGWSRFLPDATGVVPDPRKLKRGKSSRVRERTGRKVGNESVC